MTGLCACVMSGAALAVPVQDEWKRKVPKSTLKPLPRRQENVADDPR